MRDRKYKKGPALNVCPSCSTLTFRLFLLEELTLSEYFIGKQAPAALTFPVLCPHRLALDAASSTVLRRNTSSPSEGFIALQVRTCWTLPNDCIIATAPLHNRAEIV